MPTMPDVILTRSIKPFVNVPQIGKETFVTKQLKKQQVLLVNDLKLHVICFMNKNIFKSFTLVFMQNG